MASSSRSTAPSRVAAKSAGAKRPAVKKSAAKKSAAKKSAAKKSAAKGAAAAPRPGTKATRDPRGGLTAAGRAAFARSEGANLRPGVKGAADTPDKMRRKGSFLRRHFANLRGPLVDEIGDPTRLALSAQAWGERIPKTASDARRLASKGSKLLEQYHTTQGDAARRKPAAKRGAAKRATAKRATAKRSAGKRSASHSEG